MLEIVGVRFRKNSKIYHFEPAGLGLKLGDNVVVGTVNGLALGRVVLFTTKDAAEELAEPIKPVLRLANAEDIERAAQLCSKERDALAETNRLVGEINLPMKLISAEYNLDASHLVVFFSADGRVDFRDLVRELSRSLKVRVELRQIGPRDETKLLGGFGRCGREHCCTAFLDEFSPVSIKMAKIQDLPLNPMKISGVCGRLLCCLGYECEQYRALKERMPSNGQRVMTDTGNGVVVGQNTLEEKVLVEYETGVRIELPASKVKILEPRPSAKGAPQASRSMAAPASQPAGGETPGALSEANNAQNGETTKEVPQNESA
ncbi:MAG: stage 0 sporulation family protein [Dehalococcoidia bacterium]|nr:stage 0 sporulation family protein [Dehalococcoidia bacterium]